MSDTDPVAPLAEALIAVADRMEEYAKVWQTAAEANAAGTYTSDDLFEDISKVAAMQSADAVATVALFLDALAALKSDAEG